MAVFECVIEVTVQVDTDEPHSKEAIERAAVEAIRNAVEYGEDMGFIHALADETSIGVCTVLLA